MAELAEAIRTINARELDQNEEAIASSFGPPPKVSPEAQQRLIPFVQWCEQKRIRALPARPTSVAAYVQHQQDQGISRQVVAERLEAIEQLHFAASMANPCATPVVRQTTGGSTIEAPRSWKADEKLSFYELPPEIQAVVARREADRETQMRRAQNTAAEAAAEVRRLLKTAAETTKPVEPQKEVSNEG
jgi:hypothetical protein